MKRAVLLLTILISIQSSIKAQYARWIVEPIYDQINEFEGPLAAVKSDGKWGYINQEGVEVIACIFDKVTPFVDGVAIATTNNDQLLAIIHDNGSVVDGFKTRNGVPLNLFVDSRYPYFSSGMLLVTDGIVGLIKDVGYKKWGYIDKIGILQLPIQYFSAMPFSEGKASVADEKMRFSYIDNRGEVAVQVGVSGGRVTGAFGFYGGKALVSEKKKFSYIDETGRKIEDFSAAEPNDIYYNINSNTIDCAGSCAVIDSLGRINRIMNSNGFVVLDLVEQLPPKTPIKGNNYFVFDGQKSDESAYWITPSLAVLSIDGKYGVIKVQDTPVVNIELSSKSVRAIFGNIEPFDYTLVNEVKTDLDKLDIKCNGESLENSSIPAENLTLSFSLVKPTDAEIDVVQKSMAITQHGVLLMDQTVDVIIADEPAINIIGRDDLLYYDTSNTASLSVDIQNTSKHVLEDAILMINNYQKKITVQPYSSINCPAFFGVVPEENKIEVTISVKHEKAQIVTKQGAMLIDN